MFAEHDEPAQTVSSLPLSPIAPIVASIRAANILDGGDSLPMLLNYYGSEQPQFQLQQLLSRSKKDPQILTQMLWQALDLSLTPRLKNGLSGLFSCIEKAGIDPNAAFGAPNLDALLSARPSAAALFRGSLFGGSMAMLGVPPVPSAPLAELLTREDTAFEVFDQHLSGLLCHELCHGVRRPPSALQDPAESWLIQESGAILLGMRARQEHVFPKVHGESVAGSRAFVLLGMLLAKTLGETALWKITLGISGRLNGRSDPTVAIIEAAEWQQWSANPRASFTPDASRTFDWIKLINASQMTAPLHPFAIQAQASNSPEIASQELPDLLDIAHDLSWSELPWYTQTPQASDFEIFRVGLDALSFEHRFSTYFHACPSPLPDDLFILDTMRCEIRAKIRPTGVFDEPARWLLPPPIARQLATRGARKITFKKAHPDRFDEITAHLQKMLQDNSPLPRESDA